MNVFDDRNFERLRIGQFLDEDRHLMQLRLLRRPPAPFTRNNFISVRFALGRTHDDGLQNALLADRVGEIGQFLFAENMAGLKRIGAQEFDRDLADTARRGCCFIAQGERRIIADQGSKASSKAARAFFGHCHHPHLFRLSLV